MDNKPIFSVSAQAISMVAEISALLEHHNIAQQKTDSLKLRKINQIKTIQSSLAIEGNSLSEKQVTDILNGKKVVSSVTIDPDVVDVDDIEMLEDLIVAALNDGYKKADDMTKQKMPGGLM